MAIYHLSVKTISRSSGRTATGAAAYRAAERVRDECTGDIHDYTRKGGVEFTEIVTPDNSKITRSALWNLAEKSENRKNSTVAREYEVALPAEMNGIARRNLAVEFAKHVAKTYGVVADVAIHAPNKKGDQRNHHAHILTTTRRYEAGQLTTKTRELDDQKYDKKLGMTLGASEIVKLREVWEAMVNRRLGMEAEPVSCKSNGDRELDEKPTRHLGVVATAIERRGITTPRGERHREILAERQTAATPAVERSEKVPEQEVVIEPPKRARVLDDVDEMFTAAELKELRQKQEAMQDAIREQTLNEILMPKPELPPMPLRPGPTIPKNKGVER